MNVQYFSPELPGDDNKKKDEKAQKIANSKNNGLIIKNEGKLLTNDGREIFNENK